MRTIIFDQKDSWEEYGLLTLSIEPTEPKVKKATIDIAGRDGVLDVSEAVAGHVVFENAELVTAFRAIDDEERTCKEKRDRLISDIHGKKHPVRISDEEHSYFGRCEVVTTADNGYYLEIQVTVDAEPFKKGNAQEEITEQVSGSKTIEITNNGDSYVVPTITISSEMTLTYDTVTTTHSAGTFKAAFAVAPHDVKEVTFSGSGTVTIIWEEGYLV